MLPTGLEQNTCRGHPIKEILPRDLAQRSCKEFSQISLVLCRDPLNRSCAGPVRNQSLLGPTVEKTHYRDVPRLWCLGFLLVHRRAALWGADRRLLHAAAPRVHTAELLGAAGRGAGGAGARVRGEELIHRNRSAGTCFSLF